jgi:tRNA(fMet)-specific endonuclease VapC
MYRYMLDTNICIYVIKNRPNRLRTRFNDLAEDLCISVITLAELVYGAEKSAKPYDNLRVAEQFCARLGVLPFTERAATHYGQLWAELERTGRRVGIHGMMIGGHARSEGLTVVTNNVREFQRIAGLRVENWVAS